VTWGKEESVETPRKGLRGYRLIILAVVGALLAIFGALWISVIFPALDKMPADYSETYNFEGTFAVMNPATQQLDTFPVEQSLVQQAVGTEDGALLIHETRSVVNEATGADMSAIYGDDSTLAIDARTLEYQQSIDERGRWGQFGPPRPLSEGESFDMWNPAVQQPLTANYLRTEDLSDMTVFVYEMNAQDVSLGNDPQSGLPLLLSTTITLWVEPSSGTVVNNYSVTTTSLDMMGTQVPVQIARLHFTEGTIASLTDTARSAHWMLLWFRTLVPWLAMGFGAFLVVAAAVTVMVRNLRKAKVGKPTEHPRPTYV
jgi:hypothetical protein